MKSYRYYPEIKIRNARAKTFVRLSILAVFGLGFSLPAAALDLQNILDSFGNPKIARRLNRDLNTVGRSLEPTQSLTAKRPEARCNKHCPFDGQYRITDLGSLGGTASFAYSINNHGTVVGLSRTQGDTETHPFVFLKNEMADIFPKIETPEHINNFGQVVGNLTSGGLSIPAAYNLKIDRTKLLGTLGGATASGSTGTALDNNDNGQIVGYSYLDSINKHAFLYDRGTMRDIGSFGGYSNATAINKQGAIVGFSSNTINGRAHAFFFAEGKMKDISPVNDPTFENSESYARDVNNKGVIVGEFFTPDQKAFHAFIYKKGKLTTFNLKGSDLTVPFSINKHGKIVGIMDVPYNATCLDPEGKPVLCTQFKQHAFLYRKGRIIDLNRLISNKINWELSWAFGINDKGQIVGYGVRDGNFRAFLLSPTSINDNN